MEEKLLEIYSVSENPAQTMQDYFDELEKYFAIAYKLATINHSAHADKVRSVFFAKVLAKNPHFALYAPAETFCTTTTFHLEQLSKEERINFIANNLKSGIFSNETFREYHLRYFPELISTMTEVKDVIFALNHYGAKYFCKLSKEFLEDFNDSTVNLAKIIKYAPKTIAYFDDSTMEIVNEHNLVINIGIALERLDYDPICLLNMMNYYKKEELFKTVRGKKSVAFSHYDSLDISVK
ncbi:MAG: hypothetical protein E7374_01140 [Clostridiales bacterium]|nr:hypothetical protein [Clostridiales bacterium]